MCMGCYDEYFSETEPPPVTEDMAVLAAEIEMGDIEYELTYSGLHIVIGDWNLEDGNIGYCISQTDKPLTEAQLSIAHRLLALTEAQRYVVMREAHA